MAVGLPLKLGERAYKSSIIVHEDCSTYVIIHKYIIIVWDMDR